MGFLNDFFGPPKEEIWKQIADEIGGEFVDYGIWGNDTLSVKYKNWELLLDTYQTSGKHRTIYTRLRVPFMNRGDFRFTLYKEDLFTSIGKIFGMQDVQIGDSFFDEKFIIKSNDVNKVKYLLSDKELRKQFEKQLNVSFKIKDDKGWFHRKYPKDVTVLYFQTRGIITDKEELHGLFHLFMSLLDRLVYINAANDKNPNLKLN